MQFDQANALMRTRNYRDSEKGEGFHFHQFVRDTKDKLTGQEHQVFCMANYNNGFCWLKIRIDDLVEVRSHMINFEDDVAFRDAESRIICIARLAAEDSL